MRRVSNFRLGQFDSLSVAMISLLLFATLLGGASRLHELRLALVELIALPLLVLALGVQRDTTPLHKFAFCILAATAALPVIQLIPLPPAIWTALPGRSELVLALDVAELPQGWLPLTLTPDKTWRSFLALVPPVAMFLGVVASRPEGRLPLIPILLSLTLASMLLGAAQLASGGDQLYPWTTTDAGGVTGFFANRNHLATLCLIGIPFATVSGASALRRKPEERSRLWFAVLYVGLAAVALGVIRSRTGVVLFAPVLGASLLAAWIASGRGRPQPLLLCFVGASVAAIAAVAFFAAAPLLERFDTSAAPEGRFENWPVVAAAAESYLPLGSGLGSFDAVYRSVEPLERLDPTYFNQAHNDYLETWLEAGWVGVALISAFLVWFGRRVWTAWRSGPSTSRDLQRAASIAIGVVLLHSAVDYPLRTATVAVVFAMCCGFLELARIPEAERSRRRTRSD